MGAAFEVSKQMCDIEKDLSEAGYFRKICEGQIEARKKLIDMEKNKMTKAEAFEWLKCKKVSVSTQQTSREVQSKLFACGVQWKSGGTDFCDYGNYYVINSYGLLGHCDGMYSYWECLIYEEISADDILSIEIVEENRSEDELVEIVELGEKIQRLLPKLSGHRHVVITETDVLLYDEGMCLSHSDPF